MEEKLKCCKNCLKCPDYDEHNFCHNKECECHSEPIENDWDIKNDIFLKQWTSTKGANEELIEHIIFMTNSLLSSKTKEVKEMIDGMKKEILNKIDAEDDKYWKVNRNHNIGYNQALEDIKNKL